MPTNIIWKDASERALSELNRTTSVAWTDLDITAYTSAAAKFAVLNMVMALNAAGSANWNVFQIRKNGTTPTYVFECAIPYNFAVESQHRFCVIIGLDTGQVIEYKIDVGTDCTISCTLDAMGYVE